MKFNQCVARAFYRTAVTHGAQQPAHQRGLARAEIAFEPDHHARLQPARHSGAQGEGIGFAGQG